jgi:malonyl-CoA O-methyltransferase
MTRAEQALPAVVPTRRAFDRASLTFRAASAVHDEARGRLLERLLLVRIDPRTVVDLGSADARAAAALAERFPKARVLAADTSRAMLEQSDDRADVRRLVTDAERLAFVDDSAELIFANLLLPWCRPEPVFAEAARVLAPGGLLLFSTFGPDTLQELRRAWAVADDRIHVHAFYDMHDLGDLAVAQGLLEPVMDVDRLTVTYPDTAAMVADFRACGAVNVAAGRRRTLTGPRRWAAFEQALAIPDGRRLGLTIELILGLAWGGARRPDVEANGEVAVPLDRIRHRRR